MAYIRAATVDVIYTDYVRLIHSYLPNVWSFEPYTYADVLTRMPINYIERMINVGIFGYSTTFDMLLGAFCLFLASVTLAKYCADWKIFGGWFLAIVVLFFSLNKWEMLTNGSGWVHFAAFACFFRHYYVFDKKRHSKELIFWPIFTILLVAGPYCAVYAGTMLLANFYLIVKEKKVSRQNIYEILAIFIPLLLFMYSRAHSVEEHAGATTMSMGEVMKKEPFLFVRLLIKSFASMVVSGEYAKDHHLSKLFLFALGLAVMGAYLYALYLNIACKLYEKTVFPMLLLISGGMNHLLIAISRWIFLKEDYGMSSRYALQFQVGIVGILLTFAFVKKASRRIGVAFCLLFVGGNLLVNADEVKKADSRKQYFIERRELGLHFEQASDQELKEKFQYRSPQKTREALRLLKEQHLNIFRN